MRAHVAFEHGRSWGREWAVCVEKFFDFEAAWGYVDEGPHLRREHRPQQVNGWLTMGRKWSLPLTLGTDLGTRDREDLWIGAWWKWWTSLQPKERTMGREGGLSRPDLADWSEMAVLHGRNGLLQVMATLLWWGDEATRRTGERASWLEAVSDVTWVLERVLASGDISR
ncbi:hypothetical protein C8R45DRAFT_826902 [Mycena sanguinolenta]|nr:hypothetical protein C8R45DRAFT_826902 [Mycena sanguinolenta]